MPLPVPSGASLYRPPRSATGRHRHHRHHNLSLSVRRRCRDRPLKGTICTPPPSPPAYTKTKHGVGNLTDWRRGWETTGRCGAASFRRDQDETLGGSGSGSGKGFGLLEASLRARGQEAKGKEEEEESGEDEEKEDEGEEGEGATGGGAGEEEEEEENVNVAFDGHLLSGEWCERPVAPRLLLLPSSVPEETRRPGPTPGQLSLSVARRAGAEIQAEETGNIFLQ